MILGAKRQRGWKRGGKAADRVFQESEGWRERGIKWEVNEPVDMGGRFVLCSEFAWTDCREGSGEQEGCTSHLGAISTRSSRAIRSSLFPLWITDETKEGELFRPAAAAAVSLCYVCRQRVAPTPPPPPKEEEEEEDEKGMNLFWRCPSTLGCCEPLTP